VVQDDHCVDYKKMHHSSRLSHIQSCLGNPLLKFLIVVISVSVFSGVLYGCVQRYNTTNGKCLHCKGFHILNFEKFLCGDVVCISILSCHSSVTLGGFGVDRFYLEQWGSAVGKLVSFGGLGVWTILDVILVATGFLGPADGSLYIY